MVPPTAGVAVTAPPTARHRGRVSGSFRRAQVGPMFNHATHDAARLAGAGYWLLAIGSYWLFGYWRHVEDCVFPATRKADPSPSAQDDNGVAPPVFPSSRRPVLPSSRPPVLPS